MGISTREKYVERLRKHNPVFFMSGKKVENLVDDPRFQGGINSVGITYDIANDSKYRDLTVVESPFIREPISRWTQICENMNDAIAKNKLMRVMGEYCCFCHYRCLTHDMLNAAWVLSYEVDKRYNTEYHKRVRRIVEKVQKEDLILGGSAIDPKGDRSLGPAEQEDIDVHLHVVDKGKEGIVVKGAKCHSTAAAYTDMLCVFPCRILNESEKEFAVAFFTPVDAEGITFIGGPPPMPLEPKKLENPLSRKFGHVECFTVYDNVFVPWENVFWCGEYEFSSALLNPLLAFHVQSKCGCRAAAMELDIGATALIADMNGVGNAPHIQSNIMEMIMNTEIAYGCGVSAAVEGYRHESGVFIPNPVPACSGKVFAARKLGEHRYYMQDSAGGLVGTMATEEDYLNPETGKYMEKYLKGKKGLPTEQRIRAFKLIEELTKSPLAGWYHAMCVSGGFGPEFLKSMTRIYYDVDKLVARAKEATGIKG